MTITPTGEALRRALDGPHHEVKQRWRAEVSADDMVRDPAMPLEQAREWALEKLVGLAERKFAIAGFPEEVGGQGTQAQSVAHFEMLAMGDLSLTIKSGVQHGLFGGAITNLGTQRHHLEYLPATISCERTGCFAMTELGHGSDVQSVETTITWLPDSSEFEVHSPTPSATKAYIGNAGQHGKWAAVFGQLVVHGENHGVHVALVQIRDDELNDMPGVTTGDQGHKGGLLGVDNGTITFDHLRVPREQLLDRYGGVDESGTYTSPIESKNARFFTMLGTLVRGRICVAGGAASGTRKALSIATRYGLQRTQFRRPGLGAEITLLDYQTHQRKLLPEIARAYAYGFAMNELSLALQRVSDAAGSDPRAARELETRAAGMKVALTRWANDTIQVAREACGGAGYMSSNGITQIRQDADVFATFEGDNTVLSQLVAKALLLDYKQTWGDLDLRGTAQATARMLGGTFLERTTARSLIDRLVTTASRQPESDKLRARGWHVQMFEDRERHVVEGLAKRMRAAGKLGADEAFAAINACQEHMLVAARAHTDRVVLEAFIEAIDHVDDPYINSLLVRVCDLFALATMEEHRAWYLEHERIDASRSKAITQAVDDLCQELRPVALELVEGLGVEERWLNSAMLDEAKPAEVTVELAS
ncbi:acyl-CoA dehydrogenase family protein [Aestuariimicrobium ganziense]|uniref:acyl-CoA dehydrogenase family protein n=1 Tax=Aestuariimicrobium ganziense TaxID=2773677 RepID=UPI00194541CC|nr:acyl-CoA dehydrogenase [Aestuariimicrobium ganziense]